ncbi:type I restriction endonuclease subunit R [Brachyspira aalborgi]|uniref:type I restriction endonuclease subunit R n=1 Tax=Brachyspira aalborgi TaxID=29522 RepID=UPI0011CC89D5|nr:type I restriction endonuclease subunit R [Brachyspira aalborgi]TXJ50067.1 type I restriction endonuclease subunit R [Brachyspira aalborgi]
MQILSESDFENSLIDILVEEMEYEYKKGADLREEYSSMNDYHSVVIKEILEYYLKKINKNADKEAIEETVKKIINLESLDFIEKNKFFQNALSYGIYISYFADGKEKNAYINLIDYKNKNNNNFLVVNQLTIEDKTVKRPDIIIYVNGLPLVVMELKNALNEDITIENAYKQIRNYIKNDIPSLFEYNAFLVISDMINAKVGTITSDESRFISWKKEDKEKETIKENTSLDLQYETLIKGMFEKSRFLDIVHYFLFFVYDPQKKNYNKILTSYHQYFASIKAIEKIEESFSKSGSKTGIIWHTTGAGKSYTMLMISKLITQTLNNPTIVIITDRNNLDDQLFNSFSNAAEYLSQNPIQASSREHLKKLLKDRETGGIIFTTLQKFEDYSDILSKRKNIILMIDEAHRSHYGDKAEIKKGEIIYGMSKYIKDALPNAIKIGFTGTPIEKDDRSTIEVFGDYIDIYDITQSVEDGVTVPIYYEGRVNNLKLNEDILKKIDEKYESIKNQTSEYDIEKSKRELSKMDAILGSEDVIDSLCKDIIKHYEERKHILLGKAMIVAYSRPIGIKIYKKILSLKSQWKENLKPVMTTTNDDPEEWRNILGTSEKRKELAFEFKKSNSDFKIALVVDMWLTGFDVPSLNTMYIYKPLSGHNLMQTISRVNRAYKDKEGGLIVDYIGLASSLKEALSNYTKRDNERYRKLDIEESAFPKFKEALEIIREIFYNKIDYSNFYDCSAKERENIIKNLADYIISNEDKKKLFIDKTTELKKAETLCISIIEQKEIVETALYEAVKVIIVKISSQSKISLYEINKIISEMLKNSVRSEGIINIFNEREIKEVSVFDYEYLKSIASMKHKNLSLELLHKLLADKIKGHLRVNIVQSELFSKRMKDIMNGYKNRMITNAEVIEELLKMGEDLINLEKESDILGLSAEEKAFYDAILKPPSIKKFYTDETLKQIAVELTDIVRKSKTIDWERKESTRAKMRLAVKKLLRKYKYPPENQEEALDIVIRQAENIEYNNLIYA